ncbi:MAG: hypothetical protein D6760_00020 [Deltaproteobacteria bacterium]|nr:MAG: hypothetical protein D6760_00020 [Deltaproteobacteria bacterium]
MRTVQGASVWGNVMDTQAVTLPGYEFLSAPWWLITTLHIVTLTLHFAAMNFLFGGLIVLLAGRFEGGWRHPVVSRYVTLLPSAMAATITLGVAPLLFTQLVYHRQVYSAAIISAWFWLGILALAVVAYYLFYAASFAPAEGGKRARLLVPAVVVLLAISFLYSSVFSLAERPDAMKTIYAANQSGWVLNPHFGDYSVRWLLMVLGAVAVGGFCVGVVGRDNDEAFEVGRRFFTYSVIGASVLGVFYLGTLGEQVGPFMRGWGIRAVTIGLVLTLASLWLFSSRRLVASGVLLFVSLGSMVFARHELRLLRLGPVPSPAVENLEPQWSIFAVFLVCFVLMLAVLAYMLRSFFSSGQSAETP